MNPALLQVHDLNIKQAEKPLLNALNLSIHPGECWAVLGRNGSGKTSLLHTLAGVRPAQSGKIELLGRPLATWNTRQRARQIGLLTQDPSEGFEANVREAAQSGRHPYIENKAVWNSLGRQSLPRRAESRDGLSQWPDGADDEASIVQRALDSCGLHGFEQRRVNSLSGGERRRLGIATLLAQNPPLMLLDEPLNHLDMAWQWCILRQLRSLADQGHGLMMSLHDPNMALRSCGHALLIHEHGAWQAGRVDELLTAENLHTVYGIKLRQIQDDHDTWLIPERA